jgi:ABC-type multidrug transport system fused ATPase/permease subunit
MSFVSYLIKSHGGVDALKTFLSSYEPERRDEAANKVYQQPLASLEESWMSSVARGKRGDTAKAAFKYLFPLLKPHKLRYAEVLGYQFLTMLLTLALPLTSGCVIGALGGIDLPPGLEPQQDSFCNFVAPNLTTGRLVGIVLVLILIYVIEAGVGIRKTYAENKLFQGIGADLQERLFRHLQKLPHSYYSSARVGDITSRLSRDMEMLQGSLDEVFGNGVQMSISAAGAALTAVLKSPVVGAIVFLIIPVFIASYKILGAKIADTSFEVQEMTGDVMATSQENLSAHSVIKAFGLEDRVGDTYRARVQQLLKKKLQLNLVTQFFTASINMAVNLGQMIVLGVGGYLVLSGSLNNAGTLVTLLLLLPSVFVPIAVLADVGQSIQTASGSVERISQIFEEPVSIEDKPDAKKLQPLESEIKLENVSFGYSDDRLVLDDIDVTIPSGKNVAIVGPSGSGKSTIVNLVMRFWDPGEGTVTFDGTDIRDASLASLRGQIGIVFQDTFVFNSTLRDNIAIGRLGATDAEIEAAAQAAQLDSYVEQQPAGYDTVLGERGVRMSGGQRQRLAIARALLRNPAILILDEATSALDAGTEAEILETLASVVKSRTTITITHRLVMAAMADIIVVLDGGKVAEVGPHKELVKSGGLYQRLYEEQTGKPQAAGRADVDLETALKKIPIFSKLSESSVDSLANRLVVERFGEGSPVVKQGDAGDKLYVIKSGGADVLVNDGHNERRVNTLQAGDYFGEYALLAKDRRTATVLATSPMEVWALSKDDFAALLKKEPTLKRQVTKLVKDRRTAYDAAAEAAGITTRLSA